MRLRVGRWYGHRESVVKIYGMLYLSACIGVVFRMCAVWR